MKTLRNAAMLGALLLVAAAVAGVAQPRLAASATPATTTARTITVTGTGSVTAVPDRASFQFGVTTRAATAKDALSRNAAAAAAVIAALKANGVAAGDLQTSGVSLSPESNSDGTAIVGYSAFDTVSAKIALAKAGALVDAAVAAGADTVYGPGLDVSDRDALYAKALAQAVADAKAKAKTLAESAGVALGAVQSLVEGGAPTPMPLGVKASAGDTAATPVEPGTQEVDASVTVVYAIG